MPQVPPPVSTAPAAAPKKTAAKKKAAPAAKPAGHDGHGTAAWFARQVLHGIGVPITDSNVRALVSWEAAEGGHWGNTARYNPINTTQAMPGDGGSMNSVGVRVFTSWHQGIAATVKTLENGNYGGILTALHNGHDAGAVLNAVVASPWSTYPNGIHLVGSAAAYGTGAGHGGGGLSQAPASKASDYLNNNVATQYGYLSAYLNDPEVGPILREAAAGQWSQDRMLQALEKTQWWQHTALTARQVGALQKEDPATFHAQWSQQRQGIAAEASQMGVNIDPKRLNQLTTTSMFSGWDSSQLAQAIGAEFHYDPTAKYVGTAGATLQKLKANASQYLVPLSDGALQGWTRQVLEGKKNSSDDFNNYLAGQSKTLFPWMAKAIDGGVTPTQYLDPYRQAAASTLELDASGINLGDAKWRRLFETTDPKTGDRTERGLADAMTMMKTDPIYNYDSTQGAQQQAASLAQQIGQSFGFTAA